MTPVTPEKFKAAKPQFATVDDAVVQSYLDLALILVGESWPTQEIYDQAIISMTCHLMTLDGLGTDPGSSNFALGNDVYETIKTGVVTLTRFKSAAQEAGISTKGWLSQTKCGQFYMVLNKSFHGGPRIAFGGVGPIGGPTAYAKDGWFW